MQVELCNVSLALYECFLKKIVIIIKKKCTKNVKLNEFCFPKRVLLSCLSLQFMCLCVELLGIVDELILRKCYFNYILVTFCK